MSSKHQKPLGPLAFAQLVVVLGTLGALIALSCSAVREAKREAAAVYTDPTAALTEAQRVCYLYELGNGARAPELDALCGALTGECVGAGGATP